MREVAEWYATRPDVALIFEGKVVKQEVRSGSIGGPPTAMSMTLSAKHRVVEFDVTRVFRGTNQAHLGYCDWIAYRRLRVRFLAGRGTRRKISARIAPRG